MNRHAVWSCKTTPTLLVAALFAAAILSVLLAAVPAASAGGGAPNLVLTKDDGGVFAVEGGGIAYESHYVNAGTADASGVEVVETVPEHTTFHEAGSTDRWTCPDGSPPGTLCRFADGTLEPGDTGRARFAVRVDAEVPLDVVAIVNTVTISDDGTHGPDPSPGDNTASDSTPFHRPDLVVTKDDGGIEAEAGDVVAYEIHYVNAGTADASGVEVTETVPGFTTFDAGRSTGGWSCPDGSPAGTACVFLDGTLEPGDSGRARFVVALDSAIPPGVTEIVNTVTVTDDGSHRPDLDPRDNTATDTTPLVQPPPGSPLLDAFMTDVPDRLPAEPGDAITYIATVENAGDAPGVEVEFAADAPEHTALVAGTVSTTHGTILEGQDPGDASVVVRLGELAPGEEAVVTFQVAIDAEIPPGVDEIVCQGSVVPIFPSLGGVLTDDPDTSAIDDPTRTPLAVAGGPGPAEIPAAGTVGLLVLVALLFLAGLLRLRTSAA